MSDTITLTRDELATLIQTAVEQALAEVRGDLELLERIRQSNRTAYARRRKRELESGRRADPEYRARMNERNRERERRRRLDPNYRESRNARRRERNANEPEHRERLRAQQAERRARKKAEAARKAE